MDLGLLVAVVQALPASHVLALDNDPDFYHAIRIFVKPPLAWNDICIQGFVVAHFVNQLVHLRDEITTRWPTLQKNHPDAASV